MWGGFLLLTTDSRMGRKGSTRWRRGWSQMWSSSPLPSKDEGGSRSQTGVQCRSPQDPYPDGWAAGWKSWRKQLLRWCPVWEWEAWAKEEQDTLQWCWRTSSPGLPGLKGLHLWSVLRVRSPGLCPGSTCWVVGGGKSVPWSWLSEERGQGRSSRADPRVGESLGLWKPRMPCIPSSFNWFLHSSVSFNSAWKHLPHF